MEPGTLTAVPLVVLVAVGMPRFSARLLAIADWGSRRRDVGGAGEVAVEEVLLPAAPLAVAVLVVESERRVAVLPCFSLRGASLIRPASLRWWSSRRLRMRRAYVCVSTDSTIHVGCSVLLYSDLGVMRVLHRFVEGGRSAVMLLSRGGYAVVVGGRRSGADVLVGFGEGGRLHRVGGCGGGTCSVWRRGGGEGAGAGMLAMAPRGSAWWKRPDPRPHAMMHGGWRSAATSHGLRASYKQGRLCLMQPQPQLDRPAACRLPECLQL
jgi:hypothetical protein